MKAAASHLAPDAGRQGEANLERVALATPSAGSSGAEPVAPLIATIERTLRDGHRWLRFSPALEKRFEADGAEARRRHLLVTGIIGTLLYFGFAFTDPLVMPDVKGLLWEQRARVMPVLTAAILGSWFSSKPWLREVLTTAGMLMISIESARAIGLSHAPAARSHLAILSLVTMFAGITARMPFWYSLLISLATVAAAMTFVHAESAFQSLILRDAITMLMAVTLFTLLAGYALEYRERSRYLLGLLERQQRRAVLGRNRDMRLVLDNVDQALLTVNDEGLLAEERSAMVDRWFGSYAAPVRFVDYIANMDPAFAAEFQLGHEALREDVLPFDMCLSQLPTKLSANGRRFRCRYQSLPQEPGQARPTGLLVVIDDITDELRHAQEQAELNELTAVMRGLMRDRSGLLIFFDEGGAIVHLLGDADLEPSARQRLLHTLKGNAAIFGLDALSSLCHDAEEQIKLGEPLGEPIRLITERWQSTVEMIRPLVGEDRQSLSGISAEDVGRLADRIKGGMSTDEILAELTRWNGEPIERGLGRLAQHAVLLAQRLGKGKLVTEVHAPSMRLDPAPWNRLCSALVHVVRNAVDHGVETPAERQAAGKSLRSLFVVRARAIGDAFVIEIADDGRGIDWAGVSRLAIERHMPARTRADLVAALLTPGFSTRAEVTATSGRGVGLAAVAQEVRDVGGAIEVMSEPGQGTTWRFSFVAPFGTERPAPHPRPAAAAC